MPADDTRNRCHVTVKSTDGYPEKQIAVPDGSTYAKVLEEYAHDRQVPVAAVTLNARDGTVVPPRKRVDRGRVITATLSGLHALRKLFDLYDSPGMRSVKPNQRPEVPLPVNHIVYGTSTLIDPWHSSPYPRYLAPHLERNGGVLYVCDVCLRYAPCKEWMEEHVLERGGCAQGDQPPGTRIFTSGDEKVCVWRVDGGVPSDCVVNAQGIPAEHTPSIALLRRSTTVELYAQHVSLLARFFLKSKTAFYSPGSFYFYVLTELCDGAHRFRGFFSVDKRTSQNSLACITVLPPWQDRGFGRLLIHISYLLCKARGEGSVPEGGPERPLSDLGMKAFLSYWCGAIRDVLYEMAAQPEWNAAGKRADRAAIQHIVAQTGICSIDVVKALHKLELLVTPGKPDSDLDWEQAKKTRPVDRGELRFARNGRFALTGLVEADAPECTFGWPVELH